MNLNSGISKNHLLRILTLVLQGLDTLAYPCDNASGYMIAMGVTTIDQEGLAILLNDINCTLQMSYICNINTWIKQLAPASITNYYKDHTITIQVFPRLKKLSVQ